MIVLPNRRVRAASVPFLFRASDCIDDAGLFALGYGQRLAGVFTRASRKRVVDQNGRLAVVPSGMPAVGRIGGDQALLLEPARTNLCIRSEEFSTWTVDTATVTSDAIAAPDGTLTADLITASANTAGNVRRSAGFTGDGEKCHSVFMRAGSSGRSRIDLFDNTAAVARHHVNVTWTAGVPVLSTSSGSGTLYPVEPLWGGWYRLSFSATGVVAANTNLLRILPDSLAGTGSVYVWGAQAEDFAVPSSYIPTAATTVARAQDFCYFPFVAPPQAMTVYMRGQELGQSPNNARWYAFASAGSAAPRLLGLRSGTNMFAFLDSGGSSIGTAPVLAFVRGSRYEMRHVLYADTRIRSFSAKDGGAEVASTISGPLPLGMPAAWSAPRLYLADASSSSAQFGFSHAVVVFGEQSLDTMRELAGV